MDSLFSILIVLAILIIPILLFVYLIIYSRAEKYVIENSITLKQITLLSNKYSFYPIESCYIHQKYQKSLASFRRMSYYTEFLDYVKSKQPFFQNK